MVRLNGSFVEREIRSWSFDAGPVISSIAGSLQNDVLEALRDSTPTTLCAIAGRLLEDVADNASCELGTSVTRRRRDRYTLGDTWPGVLKALKKTDLLKVAEEVERWQPLRNLVGAHFNEWAGALTLVEAQRFAESVLALDSSLTCPRCGRLEGTGIAVHYPR